MRCAIDCVEYLYAIWQKDSKHIIHILEEQLSEAGISIYDLVKCLQEDENHVQAYYSYFLPKEENTILYLHRFRVSHFIVLIKKSFFYVWIYDAKLKKRKIAKWRIYFLYSKKYILCYNNKKR